MAQNTVLFLGTHKTGTKALAQFFQSCVAGVEARHEPAFGRTIRILTTMYLEGLIGEKLLKRLTYWSRIKKIPEIESDVYIETSAFNYYAGKYIKEALPETKIVHIVRDPRDFVISFLNYIDGRTQSWIANNLTPFWNVSGVRAGNVPAKKWRNYPKLLKFAWHWNFKNQLIEDLYAHDKPNYFFVKFENLVNPKTREATLQQIFSFLNIEFKEEYNSFFDEKRNESKSNRYKKWPHWDTATCKELQFICNDLMQKYGYGYEPEWLKKTGNEPGR